jgi:uncharacterized protein YbdZ (MbtH family)
MSQNHETKYKLYGHRLQIGASEDLNEIEYSDSKEACAAFIKKEIEEIRRIDE